MAAPADVLEFWFEGDPELRRDAWFEGGPAFDDACRRFQPEWERARAGRLDGWLDAPATLLAFILLTDQIPRNIFREDGRAFATDGRALAAARECVGKGWDKTMRKYERQFVYLPFEHAEDLAAQEESVHLFKTLADPVLDGYAEAHRAVIARFGRFPHRNAMLGRESTAEERAFLAERGRGF